MSADELFCRAVDLDRVASMTLDGRRRRDLLFHVGMAYELAADALCREVQEDAADAPDVLRRAALLCGEAATRYREAEELDFVFYVQKVGDQYSAFAEQVAQRRLDASRDRQLDRAAVSGRG
jgi:hypothetical protein